MLLVITLCLLVLLDCQACCCCHPKRSMACYSWDGQVFYTLEDTTNLFVWNDNCTPIDWSIVLSQVRTAQGKIWSRRTPQRVCRCTNLAGYATLVPLWPNLKIIILNLAKYFGALDLHSMENVLMECKLEEMWRQNTGIWYWRVKCSESKCGFNFFVLYKHTTNWFLMTNHYLNGI